MRGERERVREREGSTGGGWLQLGESSAWLGLVVVGPWWADFRLGFSFFVFLFRNTFLDSSKIHKKSPKLFINKILVLD
jgi:hypothetical protein